MRLGYLAIIVLLTTSFVFCLQQPPLGVLEKDTYVPVRLVHSLDAGKANVGDKVEAQLQEPLFGRDGVLIAHMTAKVVGHVILVQRHTDQPRKSMIVMAFDSIVDDTHEIPVTAVLTRKVPPRRKAVQVARIGDHPTSGDNPTLRAGGPYVDRSSMPVTPTSEGGLTRPEFVTVPEIGPIEVAANELGQTRLIAMDKKDVKIKTDVVLTLRLNNPRPKQ